MVITQTAIKGVDSKALATGDPGCSVATQQWFIPNRIQKSNYAVHSCGEGAPSPCSPRIRLELLNGLLEIAGLGAARHTPWTATTLQATLPFCPTRPPLQKGEVRKINDKGSVLEESC